MLKNASYLALSLSLASLAACGGSGSSGSSDTGTTGGTTNAAPAITLAATQTVIYGTAATIDATVTDAEGDDLTYIWSSNSTSITLDPTNTEDTSFTAPSADETIVLTLSVSDGTNTTSDTITITIDDGVTTPKLASWVVNTTERSSNTFETAIGGTGVLTDVQSATEQTIDGQDFMVIETEGVPKFEVTVDQDLIDSLESRPRFASPDFLDGLDIVVGDVVSFGEDIGYNTSAPQTYCGTNGGVGYWPPGPDCPAPTGLTAYVPVNPTPLAETEECTQGLGSLGIYVNGFAVFGWGDGMTDDSGNFTNSAAELEQYDLDICAGHAAMGEYHNHNYSQCMADLVGDTRDAHSPIYGFAGDGYAIHGPWESDDVLAISAWVRRDYGAATTAGGCGTGDSTQRACVLVDEYDLSAGVTQLATNGPDTDTSSANYSTPSGNPYAPVVGTFYEDFYFADNPVTGAQLDQNNGHDTDDGNGYHYHITLEVLDGELSPAFPYTFGPQFSGELADNSFSSCGGVGGGTGPGGPPPG